MLLWLLSEHCTVLTATIPMGHPSLRVIHAMQHNANCQNDIKAKERASSRQLHARIRVMHPNHFAKLLSSQHPGAVFSARHMPGQHLNK